MLPFNRSILFGIAIPFLLTACGGSEDLNQVSSDSRGMLGVSLTDSPACGFDEVNVTVNKVRVHQSGSAADNETGWVDITLNPARKINLLNLNNGVLDNLGQTPLAAGHYTQVRLVLDPNIGGGLANSVVPAGGFEVAVETPSAVQSGIKLAHEFDVSAGERVDLVLDFDACKSIVRRGNGTFALKPVIKVIPTVLNGIEGMVDNTSICSNIMVTAQQEGVVLQTTAPDTGTGRFLLARLEPGEYDVVLTADNCATAVIAAVPVVSASSITMLDIGIPIQLPPSATGNIMGAVTLDPPSGTEVGNVAARQTFGTTPAVTVTVKSVTADDTLASQTYTMTLPVTAPLFGQYSATPPNLPVEQTVLAGHYQIQASTNGYVSFSVDHQMSAGESMGIDFILTDISGGSSGTLVCDTVTKACLIGAAVGKDPTNGCQFYPCPTTMVCDSVKQICPGGVEVSKDPNNQCAFCPCPQPNVLTPPCGAIDGGVQQ